MCGIVGYIGPQSIDYQVIEIMAEAIAHRGPDHRGRHIAPGLNLTMNRLAIIDVAEGNQPFHSPDNRVHLIFNGEIYNFQELRLQLESKHQFQTHSDTEVILKGYLEWGEDIFAKLNGIFAIALFDERDGQLRLARDSFGIKPLYYTLDSGTLYFTSELKSLAAAGIRNKANPLAVQQYLSSCYVFHPESALADVAQLPPGTLLRMGHDGKPPVLKQFYRIGDQRIKPASTNRADLAAELREKLFEAVIRQTNAERPLGILLSAGVDSMSVLAALQANNMAENLATYTVFFDHEDFSEDAYVRRLAKEWKLDSHFLKITDQMVVDNLDNIFKTFDNLEFLPTCVSVHMASQLSRQHSTVLLAGNGGDELFSGYPTHKATQLIQGPLGSIIPLFSSLGRHINIGDGYLGPKEKVKRLLQGAEKGRDYAHMLWRHVFLNDEINQLMPRHGRPLEEVYAAQKVIQDEFIAAGCEGFEPYAFTDALTWMMDCNLKLWDKAGMGASVEIRVPFLDKDFFEFVAGIDVENRFKPLGKKALLKEAMAGHIPDYILNMPKRGFQSPVVGWMEGAVGARMKDLTMALPDTVFDRAERERLWKRFEGGRRDLALNLWLLGSLGGWAEQHKITW